MIETSDPKTPAWGWRLFWMATSVVLLCLRYSRTLQDFVSGDLGWPDVGGPGDAPPFYYLRRDFVEGIVAGAAELVALLLVAITWRRFRDESIFILWFTWLWLAPPIANACVIAWKCTDLMDVQHAKSGWPTLDQYLNDPVCQVAYWTAMVSALLIAFVGHRHTASSRRDQSH